MGSLLISFLCLLAVRSLFALAAEPWRFGNQTTPSPTVNGSCPSTATYYYESSYYRSGSWAKTYANTPAYPGNGPCEVCCIQSPVAANSWYWTQITPTPVVAGTIIVVVDPDTNRTSTRTEVRTFSVTEKFGNDETRFFDQSSLWRNGTFNPPTLASPRTATFAGVDGVYSVLTYPSIHSQIASVHSWKGQFPLTMDGTSTCLSNNGTSPLPAPTNFTQPTGTADPNDPHGYFWKMEERAVDELWSVEMSWYFSGQTVASVYKTCASNPPVAPAVPVIMASFLLDTSTSYGAVAGATKASPAQTPTPSAPRNTADPAVTSNGEQPDDQQDEAPPSSDVDLSPEENGHTSSPTPTKSLNIGGIIASAIGAIPQTSPQVPESKQEGLQQNPSESAIQPLPIENPAESIDRGNGADPSVASASPTRGTSASTINALLPPLIFEDTTILPNTDSQYEIEGQVLEPGSTLTVGSGSAATTLVFQSTGPDVWVEANGISLESATSPSPTGSPLDVQHSPFAPLIVGGTTVAADENSEFAIASQTLTPGGTITIGSGSTATTIALETSSDRLIAVVNGVTSQIGAESPGNTAFAPLILEGTTIRPQSGSVYIVGSQTLTPGGTITIGDGPHQTTILLQASGGTTAAVVNSVTSELVAEVAIGTQTLTAGGDAITVSGTVYSLPPGGGASVFSTTEPSPPASESASSSNSSPATFTGVASRSTIWTRKAFLGAVFLSSFAQTFWL